MRCVASYAANQRFYFVAVQLVSVLQTLQSSFQLFCRCFPPPRVLNQHPAEIVARRAQGLALRAPGRFRRRAEAASAGCHARRDAAATCVAACPGRRERKEESATLYVAKRRANKPVLPQASCRPQGSPGSGPGQLELPRPLLASEAVPSEDAGFLSHVHTDRPLGRPRGPLLQQHVGLLVVQRRPGTALLDLVCRQLLPQPLTI